MSNTAVTELSVLKDTFGLRAFGRSLSVTDVSLAFVRPGSKKRVWVSLKSYKQSAFSDGGFIFDDDADLPKVSFRAQQNDDEFVSLQVKLYPKPADKPLTFEGCRIELDYMGQEVFDNHQSFYSYFSFAFNGVMKERLKPIKWSEGAPVISKTQQAFYRERSGVAWWVTALKAKGNAAALFLGAQSAEIFKTTYSIHKVTTGHKVFIYQGLQGDSLALDAALPMECDPVLISITNTVLKTFQNYGKRVAQKLSPVPHPARRGWSSWYKYYSRISEKIIMKEAESIKARLAASGFDLLQIDDGYQTKVGDWQSFKFEFRKGVQPVAKQITRMGLKPGIWCAPFLVDVHSQTAKQVSRDWFLSNRRGKPLTYSIPKHSTNYILDVTNPKVQEWLKAQIKLYRDWGFNYLKIDFLFLAACEARRFQPQYSGMAAYRLGLKLIREAAGDETSLLLSGSIDLGGIGLGNSVRMGPDIAYDIFGGQTRRAYIKAQMAATAAHSFLNHQWFTPNTDALMVRPPLKDCLVEVMIAQAAMTGGDYILSDDMDALHRMRLQKFLHPEVLNFTKRKGALFALDYFENVCPVKVIPNPFLTSWFYNPPRIWLWIDSESGKMYLFFYNLTSEEVEIKRNLNDLLKEVVGVVKLNEGAWKGLFNKEVLNIKDGMVELTLPADSVRVFSCDREI